MAIVSSGDFSKWMNLSGSCILDADTNYNLWLTATRNKSTTITAAVDSACKAVLATKIHIHSPWNTSFTFTIHPSPGASPGQFLTFAITASPTVGTPATAGLFNDTDSAPLTPSVAVCFFTYWNNVSILVNEKFQEGSAVWNWNLDQFDVSLNKADRVRSYKAWIDYDGDTVEFYIVALDSPAAFKSVDSRVFSEKLDLSNALPAESYVGFTAATTADNREIHEILSWDFSLNFESSRAPGVSPTPGASPIPGMSAHKGTSINQRTIIGASIGAPTFLIFLLIIVFMLRRRRLLKRSSCKKITKLRVFISHTGGKDGQSKNFPISLCEKLKQDPRYDVFIDTEMRKGVDFTIEIKREAQRFDLGIVVVTKEYFEKKWPMIELVEFVEMFQSGHASVRVLPLFYTLTPGDVRALLDEKFWDAAWKSMGTEEHPVDVKKWQQVVKQLCALNGVVYKYRDGSHEAEYIQDVVKGVDSIFEEVSKNHNSYT